MNDLSPSIKEPSQNNIAIWESEYKNGHSILRYPDDALLKLFFTYRPTKAAMNVLDFGAGSGPVSEFLLLHSCYVYSCDASDTSRRILEHRLSEKSTPDHYQVIKPQALGEIPDQSLDIIIAWHVLYYLDEAELNDTLSLFRKKLTLNGVLIGTMLGDRDIYIENSKPADHNQRVLTTAGQTGAHILSFSKEQYQRIFPFNQLLIGESLFSIENRTNHYHLLVAKN